MSVNEKITKYNRGEEVSTRKVAPDPRADHVMLLTGDDVLFVHGGFADNTYYDDTWYFNITTSKWLEKKT